MSETVDRESAQAVLRVRIDDKDSGAETIRDYLVALARGVWVDGEEFSGKRPFGNSGWAWDVYAALVKAGLVAGTFDEDGYLDDLTNSDRAFAERLILAAIDELGAPPALPPDVANTAPNFPGSSAEPPPDPTG